MSDNLSPVSDEYVPYLITNIQISIPIIDKRNKVNSKARCINCQVFVRR